MVETLVGDLFESEAQTLVNTVNCVGVMGKGVALEFKKRFPEMYEDYVARCARKKVRLGEPYLYSQLFPPNILNFPTKDHWRSVSRLADIVAGLEYLKRHYREWGITSLAVPPLGCGQGQLEWKVVGPTLHRHLSELDIPVKLYAPLGTPEEELVADFLQAEATQPSASDSSAVSYSTHIGPASIALVDIIARITRETYHWPIGRIRFHKLAYFATERGLPTGLEFSRDSYGPFSASIKPLLSKLVNNGLLVENRFGRMLTLSPGPTYFDAIQHPVYRNALAPWDAIVDQVVDLLERLTTDEAELAATAHYVWKSLEQDESGPISEDRVVEEVKEWKQKRKPTFSDEEISRAVRNLYVLGWLRVDLDLSEMEEDERLLLGV
jgi:O-acetyl-ADP-ribose deacetylase (regulator of RNase III)/uncharacterized protein YwgA